MTPELKLIKQWAKEADCMAVNLYGERPAAIERMMRFAALVAAHQRELDAQICDVHPDETGWNIAKGCAAAIRGRGEAPPTRSQKLRAAGHTPRPTWRSLPREIDDEEDAP